jgi:microsomal dipeptidase-like Zn-dependent dipeptidase
MRIIDLHARWPQQYAADLAGPESELARRIGPRLSQLAGYLSGTAAAFLVCGPGVGNWPAGAGCWRRLGETLRLVEAEFSGRLLLGPGDVQRWRAEPKPPLCWGMLAVEGLGQVLGGEADLDRIHRLFQRGVRAFALAGWETDGAGFWAANSSKIVLSDLGQRCLATLVELGPPAGEVGPCPLLDLAGLDQKAISAVLDWIEADPSRGGRLILFRSRGGWDPIDSDSERPIRCLPAWMERVWRLGGVIGLTPGAAGLETPAQALQAILDVGPRSFQGRPGWECIGIGTSFPEVERPAPGLETAGRIAGWLQSALEPAAARAVAWGNARRLIERAAGVFNDDAQSERKGTQLQGEGERTP